MSKVENPGRGNPKNMIAAEPRGARLAFFRVLEGSGDTNTTNFSFCR